MINVRVSYNLITSWPLWEQKHAAFVEHHKFYFPVTPIWTLSFQSPTDSFIPNIHIATASAPSGQTNNPLYISSCLPTAAPTPPLAPFPTLSRFPNAPNLSQFSPAFYNLLHSTQHQDGISMRQSAVFLKIIKEWLCQCAACISGWESVSEVPKSQCNA